MTTVITVRGQDRATLIADPSFVYVGRRCAGWKQSMWGNPFKPGDDSMKAFRLVTSHATSRFEMPYSGDGTLTAVDCVRWYEALIRSCAAMQTHLPSIRGKRLGCWCGRWSPGEQDLLCHAVVLAKLTNELGR